MPEIVRFDNFRRGTSVHNDKLGNPDKIKVFGIRQTNITIKNTGASLIGNNGAAFLYGKIVARAIKGRQY